MLRLLLLATLAILSVAIRPASAQQSVDWPVYGGSDDHTHYTSLSQISPANVRQLRVAWTYDTHDEFPGSEMQTNPIVIDGVLYGTSPKLRVFALDAATGKELWSFDPTHGAPAASRIRHRGVVVTGDRVIFNYRNRLYALDRRTGQPITTFGDSGWVDLRAGLGRPVAGLSVSASTPGVVFEKLLIMGSTVPEALPSAPGDIRAYDTESGKLVWSFHTIPHPGEPGYDSWPPDAWKISGGVNAWSGVTLDARHAMVFVATGSASYDFWGGNRVGDDLYANSVIALDARTGKRIWHYQVLHHDLWDRDLPAAPVLVTVRRGRKPIDAVAQITKTGHVWVFDRMTGRPLFPVTDRTMPETTLPGDRASRTQHFPVLPPAFTRQRITRNDLTTRTAAAHDTALKLFAQYGTHDPFDPPNEKGTIIFPGVDGGGEWGGPAFDPETGLLYVNANEMAWLLKLVPRSDKSLYAANCASCHGENRQGSAMAPRLIGVGERRGREQIAQIIREGTGRMPAFGSALEGRALNDLVNLLLTGHDSSAAVGPDPYGVPYRNAYFDIFLDNEGYPAISPPWGTLSAIDLNAGAIRWKIPFGVYPKLAAQGLTDTGTDNYGGAIVTKNGLLFIGATTYDNTFHAFDKRTGKLLWSAPLPAAGNATPSTYMVGGKQYIVIACGGGKNGAKSGGTYVAFALP
jgi:quinoprotein glucose dehydrogenase